MTTLDKKTCLTTWQALFKTCLDCDSWGQSIEAADAYEDLTHRLALQIPQLTNLTADERSTLLKFRHAVALRHATLSGGGIVSPSSSSAGEQQQLTLEQMKRLPIVLQEVLTSPQAASKPFPLHLKDFSVALAVPQQRLASHRSSGAVGTGSSTLSSSTALAPEQQQRLQSAAAQNAALSPHAKAHIIVSSDSHNDDDAGGGGDSSDDARDDSDEGDDVNDDKLYSSKTLRTSVTSPLASSSTGGGASVTSPKTKSLGSRAVSNAATSPASAQSAASLLMVEGGTLLPPPKVSTGTTTLTLHLDEIGLKDSQSYINPHCVISVATPNGNVLEPQQTPVSRVLRALHVEFHQTVYIQSSLSTLLRPTIAQSSSVSSAQSIASRPSIFIEFRHYKPSKRKISCRCFALIESSEIAKLHAESESKHTARINTLLELYVKPVDFTRRRLKLFSVKKLYAHIGITFNKH